MATDLRIDPSEASLRKTSDRRARIGLLGCGSVGAEVARELLDPRRERRSALSRVAVAHPSKKRTVELGQTSVSNDAYELVKDPEIDVIVELIGGLELPYALLRQALVEGKSVVTANKEVVAQHGEELLELAAERSVGFYFEGAVAGAVPAVRTVAEYLLGDRIRGLVGILNGTSNYVLSAVTSKRHSFERAIEEAKANGYAEQDPSDDLNGTDAARKAAILGWLAFGTRIDPTEVFVRGLESVSVDDVHTASRLGFVLKLVVRVAESSGYVRVSVEPEALVASDPLASVDGSQNHIVIQTDLAGSLSLGGPGAGGRQTASAVLGDIERARTHAPSLAPRRRGETPKILSRAESPGRYLVRCRVRSSDAQGVISGRLFTHGIGTERVERLSVEDRTDIVVITEYTDRGCIERALGPLPSDDILSFSAAKIGDSLSG